jgi:murein L,D-transpeptidase YafK
MAAWACIQPPALDPAAAPRPGTPVAEDLSDLAVPPACGRIDRIEVWKHERILRAYCRSGGVVAMEIALGRNPEYRKLAVDDQRTPEGSYRVSEPPRASERFHLFIPLDYPARADAERALAEGRISLLDLARIDGAHDRGLPPPADTPLGGDIGLHGEGERWQGVSGVLDWTFGCVAVTDREIEFLAERVEPGVPVLIHP